VIFVLNVSTNLHYKDGNVDIVSMTLGAYLNFSNGKQLDTKADYIQVAEAEVVETEAEKFERLAAECDLQTSIAMMARKDDPLLDYEKACGEYYKFRDEYRARNKNKL